jgi:F5/8 type C domain
MTDLVAGVAAIWVVAFSCVAPANAQDIRIDIRMDHATNSIRPNEALGAAVDRLPTGISEKVLGPEILQTVLQAGWQTVTYRQNTELHAEAWHWNPKGTWSDPAGAGYFTGDAKPGTAPILHTYGYPLPRRGITRDDGTDMTGFSRLTDGDPATFWKSNPYLSHRFTGEDDALHPQWVILDLSTRQALTTIHIDWAQPFATHYTVQYWAGEDPIHKPASGNWQMFPLGDVIDGHGGSDTRRLAADPVWAQWVRVVMTRSSETCEAKLRGDARNCVGYAIGEISLGTQSSDGRLVDLVRHTPDQDQTATYCSSVDPWHEPANLDESAGEQIGFDLFYASGVTRGQPAMIPIAMLYNTPEDAANELRYIEARGYPVSYVEMGEEPDGHYTTPEDYGALYIQFAEALHRFDPRLKLGGPIFTGQNQDIDTWPDAKADTSWTRRFLSYLKDRRRLSDLAFFSFEHYPVDPGKLNWSSLYDEQQLVTHIMKVWRDDGVPPDVPLFITESNLSSQYSEAYMDIWGALWLADYVGAFLGGGGNALYYFHYLPEQAGIGVHGSPGTFNFLTVDAQFHVKQKLAQFYASQVINLDWIQPGNGIHKLFSAQSHVVDEIGHVLVTAYPVLRPDGSWAILLVNKDQDNEHAVKIGFDDGRAGKARHFAGKVDVTTFGRAQYQWRPLLEGGKADPDGPPEHRSVVAEENTSFLLPAASITVLRGGLR